MFVVAEGFTVELLRRHPRLRQSTAATPRQPPRRLPLRTASPATLRRRRHFAGAVVLGAATALGGELCRLLAEDGTSLWLLDAPAELLEQLRRATGAHARSLELAALRARLAAPAAWGGEPPPELLVALPPAAGSSLTLLTELLPKVSGVQHVTAVAPAGAPRELAVLRAQLAYVECTATLAVLRDGASTRPAGVLRRALALTPREAAEALYLASLRRARSPWPRPSVWPPRRGASESPAAGAVVLAPAPPRRGHDVPQRLPESL